MSRITMGCDAVNESFSIHQNYQMIVHQALLNRAGLPRISGLAEAVSQITNNEKLPYQISHQKQLAGFFLPRISGHG